MNQDPISLEIQVSPELYQQLKAAVGRILDERPELDFDTLMSQAIATGLGLDSQSQHGGQAA